MFSLFRCGNKWFLKIRNSNLIKSYNYSSKIHQNEKYHIKQPLHRGW